MSDLGIDNIGLPIDLDDATRQGSTSQRSNALSTKITSLLSVSFVDGEIRDAINSLDDRNFQNTPESRRRLRIDAQKDVIDRNGDIIRDFGEVAEV